MMVTMNFSHSRISVFLRFIVAILIMTVLLKTFMIYSRRDDRLTYFKIIISLLEIFLIESFKMMFLFSVLMVFIVYSLYTLVSPIV